MITVNFKEVDVSKHVHELEPDGLDGASALLPLCYPLYTGY